MSHKLRDIKYALTDLHQKCLSTTDKEKIHQFDLQINMQQKNISELQYKEQ